MSVATRTRKPIALHSGGKEVEHGLAIINVSQFKNEIRMSAADMIEAYFFDKTLPSGAPITKALLYHADNIDLVIDTGLEEAIDRFYDDLEANFVVPTDPKDHLILWRERYLLDLLKECSDRRIPKQYAGGIALLHLRFCCYLPAKVKASA